MNAPHADWLQPNWPAPQNVRAVCTTRAGGVSAPPFANMNLGEYVGDAPRAVAENVQALERCMGARAVFNHQVHGVGVHLLHVQSASQLPFDASVSTERGLMCTATVADCLPVLFCNAAGTVVAAAHAGWRGLEQGVLQATVAAMREQMSLYEKKPKIAMDSARTAMKSVANSARQDTEIIAWLGPCIGPTAFEVGPAVRATFVQSLVGSQAAFTPGEGDRLLANLPMLARLALAQVGVRSIWGNDATSAWCTVGNPERFFSHRRDGGVTGVGQSARSTGTGRMAAAIALV